MDIEIYYDGAFTIGDEVVGKSLVARYSDPEGRYGATAELSQYKGKGDYLYFNRLLVHPNLRRRGIATELLRAVCRKADEEGLDIFLPINPYGDLNKRQLIAFYKKYGDFKRTKDGEYFRTHKQI